MSIWQSIFFGLVQGFTEFLPISSSAHLAVLGNLFGVASSGTINYKLFTVFLHFGTIISIFIVLWNDIADMIYEILLIINSKSNPQYKQKRYPNARLFLMLFLSTLPLFLLLVLNRFIEKLYYNNIFIGASIFLTGCILFVAGKFRDTKKIGNNMTISDALIIGLCQTVGAIPGISRIGVTMTGGIAVGLRKDFAVKYAVLLSIPASFGVNVMHLVDAVSSGFFWSDIPFCLIGMAVSIITGIFSLKILLGLGEKAKYNGFAYYCWVAGVLFIILTVIF